MKNQKKPVNLPSVVKVALLKIPRDEDALLRQLYLDFRIPTDRYKKPERHEELAGFIRAWNDATTRER